MFKAPLWKGPEIDGVTQSLLSRFLVCRERFRLLVVEGLTTADTFNHRLEYGHMWHLCEEYFAESGLLGGWKIALKDYCQKLCRKYRTQQEQVNLWYNVCLLQFPIYIEYWKKNPDVKKRNNISPELVFNVPYELPSGRTVYLRGMVDSIDTIGREGIFIQENKTKADIEEQQIKRQLQFDLQTMMYIVAMNKAMELGLGPFSKPGFTPIAGVRYNVVRRPLSGGKGSIKQLKPTKSNPSGESKQEYYDRLAGIIKEDPASFFMRWKVNIIPSDVLRFEREFLIPHLEQLCLWWDYILVNPLDPWTVNNSKGRPSILRKEHFGIHWRQPYGVYNPLLEGGSTELDEYLISGSTLGLERSANLFPELVKE